MPAYTLQYLHVYVFTYVNSEAISLFEQVVSYYPNYRVGGEITVIIAENLNLGGEHEIRNYQIMELRSIISVDKAKRLPSQHTMYVRVSDTINEGDEVRPDDEYYNIDYLLKNLNPN